MIRGKFYITVSFITIEFVYVRLTRKLVTCAVLHYCEEILHSSWVFCLGPTIIYIYISLLNEYDKCNDIRIGITNAEEWGSMEISHRFENNMKAFR